MYILTKHLGEFTLESISKHTGSKIRNYRKLNGFTLQQLADMIHKSRATVSKYETGDIAIDIETLYDISKALNVGIDQLTDYHPYSDEEKSEEIFFDDSGKSPFFKADQLYYYFYDGKYKRLKEAIIHVHKNVRDENGCYEAAMSIRSTSPTGRSSEVYYTGNVLYSDMLIRFSFVNQFNKLEQDLLYIFNPLELRTVTDGLLCGISSTDLVPVAYRCLVSISPLNDHIALKKSLLITQRELNKWKKLNMLVVDNDL